MERCSKHCLRRVRAAVDAAAPNCFVPPPLRKFSAHAPALSGSASDSIVLGRRRSRNAPDPMIVLGVRGWCTRLAKEDVPTEIPALLEGLSAVCRIGDKCRAKEHVQEP
jgi:hypothetical protein